MNVSTIAIRTAHNNGEIRIVERQSRFGDTFFAICDKVGTIEVCDTQDEAMARILACCA